ncbi:putative Supervillin, partial [Danaus plexippus plexippus]
MKVLLILSQ